MVDATYLQVAQLSELLAAVIELAGEGLDLLMHNFVRSYIATLCEGFTTYIATVGPLPGVAPLMCLTESV
jgi:hypothetical protein